MSNDDTNRTHSELLARLSNLIDDIRTLKTQQWQTTYYSLLLSGAMLALTKWNPALFASWHKYAFFSLICLAALGQSYLVIFLQRSFARSLIQFQSHARSLNSLLDELTHIYEEINSHATIKRASLGNQIASSKQFARVFIALGLAGPILVILYSLFEMLDP